MKTKIAYLAAAATLSLAGAAFAQNTMPATGQTTPEQTPPSSTSAPAPATTTPAEPTQSAPSTAPDAAAAGTPSSANVPLDLKVGSEVKDPSGAVVGTIAGTSAGADGSTNVVVSSGATKFALPKASLSVGADGSLATTATKAQIDATLAGAKPQ
jgi:hypothetical protein